MLSDLIQWDPFRKFPSPHRDIDSVFDRFFSMSPWIKRDMDASMSGWVPPLETLHRDGQYLVRVDLPGVDPKDVEISVHDGTLTIKGERKETQDGEQGAHWYRETRHGMFERRLTLPAGVEVDKIHASYTSGVLEVTMPLPAALVGRKIPVQIGEPERKGLETKVA